MITFADSFLTKEEKFSLSLDKIFLTTSLKLDINFQLHRLLFLMNHFNKQTCKVIFDCLRSDKVKEEDYENTVARGEMYNFDVPIIAYH